MPERTPPGEPRQGSIFLTGATGFIGRRIQDRLIADGWHLRVLARSGSARIAHVHPQAEIIDGSLGDAAAIARGIVDAAAIINCAGVVRGSSFKAFASANVSGPRALCEAIDASSGQPFLLHLSSLAATEPTLSDYARSKREGEKVLLDFPDIGWTIIRPPAVYGPGDTEMRAALAWARRGLVPVAGGDRDQRLSMLHVDDLVAAVLVWLEAPEPHWHMTYSIDDGKAGGYDWREFAAAVSRRGPWFIGLPRSLMMAVAGINEALARVTGRAVMLSRGKVRELTHPRWVADNSAFCANTDWRPQIPLAEGVSGLFES